ncbi:MAG: sugar ABC transporter substrate-binding protein [Hamadaea sp.]|uniref:sugar ABC transporter substrate-binding protein n=1 Tax=Hamadaea sp. TaxID=2024425 RepID=UPI0017A11B03|nr:sugar ABC transporter substrate-binding protein [Hamadaea sp.]NUT24307.1 sugar ABC transporter substrate-binding protein [Hamadaea sp.]
MQLRKAVSAVAVATLTALLAACGGGGDSGDDKATVTMWIYPVVVDETQHRAYWSQTVDAFKAQNPNIDVKVEIFPWANRDEALTTAIAGNKGPDVVYLIPDQIPKYATAIEPMDSHLDAAAKSDYLDNVVKSVTMDNKLMGAPILTSALSLLCNKKVFAAVGQTAYPKTWDDVKAMAPAFKAKGYDMISYDGDLKTTLNVTFYPLLWQAGGDVFAADGKSVAFDQAPGVQALTFLKDMVDGGYINKGPITTTPPIEQSRLAQNKVACSWSVTPADLTKFWGKDNIQVLPPLTNAKQVTYGTVGSLVMLKGSKNKTAAAKWVNFATSAANVKTYDTASGFFSPIKSTGALYANDPVLAEAEKNTQYATVGPLQVKSRDVMGALAPEIQAALLGQKSPEQALKDAAKAANAMLG